ncbi:GAF domain-containing protein [Hamadaea sp. NPDC051192]|uniref:GAF domain-containing protein n=1 Tax=Hamadaea sp. NPDC051192 TaxID=3154940 RepID=UPI0034163085
MHTIGWAVQMLEDAESVEEVQLILKGSARAGVNAQGVTIVRLDDDGHCHYADEDAMSPLWKGQRFPVDRCISGWAMMHGQTVVVPDIRVDGRIPQEAYRPTFVRSLVMVPIRPQSPIGAIGAYWADLHRASADEVAALEELAAAAAAALARMDSSIAESPAPADAMSPK